ncbi:SDR family NAD(P)-dependent oxidoreductase [Paracoccus sp. (in: a-proteobacteria)]|uniref:SDR family NAD(P)-dependent oxidoreductase n=1 Tax=Paracoccus sp. TaxID=267 RepID=UPI002B001C10|nr:SDR family oxidoreductase [Paracoccus sp. (in: a-proteobacteria)]
MQHTRTAFVVGGTGGLGRAICEALARNGHRVFLTWRGNKVLADEIVGAIGDGRAVAARMDLTDPDSLSHALEACDTAFGPPDGVVFAPGVRIQQPFVSAITPGQWQDVIETELLGLTRLVSRTVPLLRETQGSLTVITSVATAAYPPGDALSAVPKAGMEMLVRALAREEGRYGVRANCVAPGLMQAGLGADFIDTLYTPEIWEALRRRIALRRFGRAEDVADIVAFLASSAAAYVTGQTIYADGGFRL